LRSAGGHRRFAVSFALFHAILLIVFRRTDLGSWKEPNIKSELLFGGSRPQGRFALNGRSADSVTVCRAAYFSVFCLFARALRIRTKANTDRKNIGIDTIEMTNAGSIDVLLLRHWPGSKLPASCLQITTRARCLVGICHTFTCAARRQSHSHEFQPVISR